MATTVSFKLYASDGITLVHQFSCIYQANYPHSERVILEHNNVRGQGSVTTIGGDRSWTITLKGVLFGADYDAIQTLVDAMETAIVIDTSYVLKIVSTGGSSYTYKCKRLSPILYEEANTRTNFLEYTCELKILTWA